MRHVLIVNPSAGGGRTRRALPAVQSALSGHGVEHRTALTESLEHARTLAREAATAGDAAVAFGGDGLVGAVAAAVSEAGGVLGVLPGGRGNDFARVLGIPLDPVSACTVLRDGEIRALDLGEADGHVFVGIASCGFDSVANRIANESRLVRGSLVYAYGALRALMTWKSARFEVELGGGGHRTVSGYTIAAANAGAYGGGMMMAPDASLTDGLLDVVIVGDAPRARFLRLLPTVFRGEHVRQPNVEVVRTASVTISASRPFTMYADGDPIADLPATVRARPGAVRTIVPREP